MNKHRLIPLSALLLLLLGSSIINAQHTIDTTLRQCSSIQLNASGSDRYFWSPLATLSNNYTATNTARPKNSTLYRADGYTLLNNILTNGGFESGNSGFNTQYTYKTNTLYEQNEYTIGDNAHRYHSGFANINDHTSGNGLYMIINGSSTENTTIWSEPVSLTDSTYYEISFWIVNLNSGSPARVQISIDGVVVGEVIATTGVGEWKEYHAIWYNSVARTAQVSLINKNTDYGGNDFGLDDISFSPFEYHQTQTFKVNVAIDTQYVNVCDAYTWSVNGMSYSESGIYDHTISTSECDSLIVLNLRLGYNSVVNTIDSACGQYTWAFNRRTYTESNVYHDTLVNGDGCINIGLLDLIILNCHIVENPDNVDDRRCTFVQEATQWSIRNSWSSGGGVSNHNTPMVGDLDDDGSPDIMCFGSSGETDNNGLIDRTILVYDGVTKAHKTTISIPGYVTAYDAGAYGLVKLPSRKGLIITACTDHYLRAFDITAANPSQPYWVSDQPYGGSNQHAVNLFFADFNNDGNPEIAVMDKIFDAATGVLLAQTANGSCKGASYAHYSHRTGRTLYSPIVANILGDDRQELILGNEIFDVVITNNSGMIGNSITLSRRIEPPSGVPNDGHAQVADFNLDGHLDILITNKDVVGGGGKVSMYVWDVGNNRVGAPAFIPCNMSGKSIPLVADIDGDDQLEVTIQCAASGVGNNRVRTYKVNKDNLDFEFMWGFPVDEDSYSNGMTAFDFNLDGQNEMLICDQSRIRVVDGSGNTINSFNFSETTIMQYPVIADVDNDGHAEIVSVGSGRLNIFSSSGQPWAPARNVWNQYVYNITCVNNDLTIPRYYYNNSNAYYDPDGVTIHRPFNNCLQQATQIDNYGRPYYTSIDMEHDSTSIDISADSVVFTVHYANNGSRTMFSPYFITLYLDSMGGNVLYTHRCNDTVLRDATHLSRIALPLSQICHISTNKLWISINDAGSGVAQDGGQPTECNLDNNGAILTLTMPPAPESEEIVTRCDSFYWDATGTKYTAHSNIRDTIACVRDAAAGCDSVRILKLTINHSYHPTTDTSVCDLFFWDATGQYYDSTTTKVLRYTSQHNCDSIVSLNLIVHYSTYEEQHVNGCNSYRWPVDRRTYTRSVTHVERMMSDFGCDSILTLDLRMHYTQFDTIYDTICQGDKRIFFGQQISEPDCYVNNSTTLAGCDSITVLYLAVRPLPRPTFDSMADCKTRTITLSMHPSDENITQWWSVYPENGSLQNHRHDSSITLMPTITTLYQLNAVYNEGLACRAAKPIQLSRILPVEASITQSAAYFTPDINSIRLSSQSQNAQTLAWFINGQFYDMMPTTLVYPHDDTINITLVAMNSRCSDTAHIKLFSLVDGLFVPNIFAPGSERNTEFRIKGYNIIEYQLYIYNRKGQLVYESDNINDAWDGTLKNGEISEQGSYVYLIRYRSGVAPDEWKIKKGTVTLLR